jgi:hypothetical protein
MAKFDLTVEDLENGQVQVYYGLEPDVNETTRAEDLTPAQLAGVAIMSLITTKLFPQDGDVSEEPV